ILCVSDGSGGEMEIMAANRETEIRPIEDELFLYTLVLEGAALRLFAGLEHLDYQYALLPEVPDEPGTRRVTSIGPAGIILTHLIDLETGRELKRGLKVRANGELHVLELDLSDYRAVEGAMLPHHYRLSINGRERAEIRLDSVRLNPGLAPWMFALNSQG
ncbi:MAG TPA: hypothetical protein VJ952_04075, partial [Opitutales bacterium]|nr:hypothetical protein [Opitutales bacterium]